MEENNVVYRVGLGRSASGKILDSNTQWFNDLDLALEYAAKTRKQIFVSYNKRRYQLFTNEH